MTSVYIRLAGPLQSWAGPKLTGNISYTRDMPSSTALTGLVAAALGLHRGEQPEWFNRLTFDVRIDTVGATIDEFHTINPTPEDAEFRQRLLSALTGRKVSDKAGIFTPDGQSKTAIAQRTFLSDAEFLIRVSAEGHIEELDHALARPHFVPYLGKKAFAPGFPFYLGTGHDELLTQVPLFMPAYRDDIWWLEARAGQRTDTYTGYQPPETMLRQIWHLGTSGLRTSSHVPVPTVKTRAEWLEAVRLLEGLHRRATLDKS